MPFKRQPFRLAAKIKDYVIARDLTSNNVAKWNTGQIYIRQMRKQEWRDGIRLGPRALNRNKRLEQFRCVKDAVGHPLGVPASALRKHQLNLGQHHVQMEK